MNIRMGEERFTRLEDNASNIYYPHTKAKVVFCDDGKNLADNISALNNKTNQIAEKANKSDLNTTNTNLAAVDNKITSHMADNTRHVIRDGTLQVGLNADKINGYDASNIAIIGVAPTNLDDAVVCGFYRLNAGHTNMPSGCEYGNLVVIHNPTYDTITQIVFSYQNNAIWCRSGNPQQAGGAGAYAGWKRVPFVSSGTADPSGGSDGDIYFQHD